MTFSAYGGKFTPITLLSILGGTFLYMLLARILAG